MSDFRIFVVAVLLLVACCISQCRAGDDALDEVNRARAARGLRPFVRDDGLTAAAMRAADFRAARLLEGHSGNDFAFLPIGTGADAAGCAAWPQEFGWGACATYDAYTHAGAAVTIGADGRRFMHLFVRGGGGEKGVNTTYTLGVNVTAAAGCASCTSTDVRVRVRQGRGGRLFGGRRGCR
jgi:hypothetical protein